MNFYLANYTKHPNNFYLEQGFHDKTVGKTLDWGDYRAPSCLVKSVILSTSYLCIEFSTVCVTASDWVWKFVRLN